MSFGFQVFDENGEFALDDKAFSITGGVATLSGSGSFPIGPEFVALGVSGIALVGKDLLWYVGGGWVYYNILNGAALDVIIYESRSTANPKMGLEIFSENGEKTFSSGDRHFKAISQTSVKNHGSSPNFEPHSEPLNTEIVYILHSIRYALIDKVFFPEGFRFGLDSLSADNHTLYVKTRYLFFRQGPVLEYVHEQIMANNPSSQLLRVRAN